MGKNYCKSKIVKEIFLLETFFGKIVERRSEHKKTKKLRNFIHLTPRCAFHRGVKCTKFLKKTRWCASHCRVKLRGVHHTMESSSVVCNVHPTAELSSAVCITTQSQNAHHRVKIEIFVALLLKGQSGEILLGVKTSIIKKTFEENV